MRGAASNTSAAATGASWLAADHFMLGRAKANANMAITAARSNSNSKCRSCSRRRFASCRRWMNRSAGNSSNFGRWRMTRCNTIGRAISAGPASSEKLTNVIAAGQKGFRVQGSELSFGALPSGAANEWTSSNFSAEGFGHRRDVSSSCRSSVFSRPFSIRTHSMYRARNTL